ncbi:DUF6455 family protein [Microvirga sp. VF16]|uniref:DUF6455 family protein n=1 Tax=Microvirga sp. VF16 TaxID=2807101 RepID=UPI00193D3B5A|nr:DUF6455 family protein [Microvirga sp. VF16]QRM36138.1 hypothetical protein JO965_46160 [Microvirga sp. VF16]
MKQLQIGNDQSAMAFEPRYNLFRRKGRPDLFCAVPEDHPIPGFVTDEYWAFAGTQDSNLLPSGLNLTAAELGVHLSGFHLFQVAGPMRTLRRAAGQSGPKTRDLLPPHPQHGPKSPVETAIKGLMKRRIAQRSRYMTAMMMRLDVDAAAATRETRGREFATATLCCLRCAHSSECGGWLADPTRGSDAPPFCPNSQFFARHSRHGHNVDRDL